MTRLGYQGKMTEVHPNEVLSVELMLLAEALGPFDHAALSIGAPVAERRGTPDGPQVEDEDKAHTGPKKQVNRQMKMTAPCGYTIRTTRKWAAEGFPTCPHGDLFAPDGWSLEDLEAAPDEGAE
jgi:hypothetical protein